jgi:hypothetical protein
MRLATLLCLLVPTVAGADNVAIGGATDEPFSSDALVRRVAAGFELNRIARPEIHA